MLCFCPPPLIAAANHATRLSGISARRRARGRPKLRSVGRERAARLRRLTTCASPVDTAGTTKRRGRRLRRRRLGGVFRPGGRAVRPAPHATGDLGRLVAPLNQTHAALHALPRAAADGVQEVGPRPKFFRRHGGL